MHQARNFDQFHDRHGHGKSSCPSERLSLFLCAAYVVAQSGALHLGLRTTCDSLHRYWSCLRILKKMELLIACWHWQCNSVATSILLEDHKVPRRCQRLLCKWLLWASCQDSRRVRHAHGPGISSTPTPHNVKLSTGSLSWI